MKKPAILIFLILFAGCNWQGQKHIALYVKAKDVSIPAGIPLCFNPDAQIIIVKANWWSMRWLWLSKDVSVHNKTDFWDLKFGASTTGDDPNGIKETGNAIMNAGVGVGGI